MPTSSRRAVLLGSTGVALAAAGTWLWNLHQHIPSPNPQAEQRFAGRRHASSAKTATPSRACPPPHPRLRARRSSATIPGPNRLFAMRGINGLLYSTVMRPGAAATAEGFRRILVAHPERLSPTLLDCCTAASEIPGATERWITLLQDTHSASGHSTLTYALRPELARLRVPTLPLWGDHDSFGPPALAFQMASVMPHAQAVTLPDAGHLAWLDQPALTENHLRTFLQA